MVNLDEFNKDDVKKVPAAIEAVVYKVEVKKAKEVYGDNAHDAEKDVIVMQIRNDEYDIKREHVMPYYDKEQLTDNSKMGKFLQKYGNLQVGNVVTLIKGENGFFEVALK